MWAKIVAYLEKCEWWKKVFSDNGTPSMSRVLTVPHTLAAIFCLIFVTVKAGKLPGATEMAGLGSFATVHYLVNRTTSAWGNKPAPAADQK